MKSCARFLIAIVAGMALSATIAPAKSRWFAQGQCGEFYRYGGGPRVNNPANAEFIGENHLGLKHARYGAEAGYDAIHHLAVLVENEDIGLSYQLIAKSSPPPAGVKLVDLSTVRLRSGVRIGTSAATVAKLLGKPRVVNVCGQQLFLYVADKHGTLLRIGVKDGHVNSIWWETQD